MSTGIYARVSTTKRDQKHGLEAQRRACVEFARAKGLGDEVVLYRDQISGRQRERPDLDRLMHDAAMKRVRAMVVFKLDRVSRRGIGDVFRVLRTLEGYGCRVYSVSESWWDPENPARELILAVIAWAAAFESQMIGERVASGIAAKKAEALEEGQRWIWGRAKVSKLIADPGLPAKALQLRSEGRSWSEIAQSLRVGRTTARRLCQIAQDKDRRVLNGEEASRGAPTE